MGILSRWPLSRTHRVTPADLDEHGAVRDDAVARWVDEAVAAYLELCATLPAGVPRTTSAVPRGDRLGNPERVVVTAGAKELFPASFTVGVRLRPIPDERDLTLDVVCEVEVAEGVGDELRDELIGLEHGARHYN